MNDRKMYFDNDDIEKKILLYQASRDRKIVDELEPVFKKLIQGVISKYKLLRRNFINDDLSQEAWVGIMEVMPKWSKEKGDAFSYFTAVVKNKIFWYLKNQYQDTSINAEEIKKTSISTSDHNEPNIDLKDREDSNFDIVSVSDYVKKLTIEDIGLLPDKDYDAILVNIQEKILSGDNVKYDDLIKEVQKEIGTPKKKVRLVLDAIYAHFMGEI